MSARPRGMTTASKTVLSAAFLVWTQKQINGLACGVGEQTFSLLPFCYRIAAAFGLRGFLVLITVAACKLRYRSTPGQSYRPSYFRWQTGQRKRRPLSVHLPFPLTRKSAR